MAAAALGKLVSARQRTTVTTLQRSPHGRRPRAPLSAPNNRCRVAGGYTGLDMGLTSPVALNGSEDMRTQSAIAPMESTSTISEKSQ